MAAAFVPIGQKSTVQPLASAQSASTAQHPAISAPTQLPPEQMSGPVQPRPSAHGAVLFAYVHPIAGLQLSSVQVLPSSQTRGLDPTQAPMTQVSVLSLIHISEPTRLLSISYAVF